MSVLRTELETCRSELEKTREMLRVAEEESERVDKADKIDCREKKHMNSELKHMRVKLPC